MKAAIVGCGNIAAVHAKSISLLEGVELAAAADIRRDRAEKYEREYGCHAYDSLEGMLLSLIHIFRGVGAENANGAHGIQPESAGEGIWCIAILLHDFKHLLPGGFADLVTSVQDPGNRSDGHASQSGYIVNIRKKSSLQGLMPMIIE